MISRIRWQSLADGVEACMRSCGRRVADIGFPSLGVGRRRRIRDARVRVHTGRACGWNRLTTDQELG